MATIRIDDVRWPAMVRAENDAVTVVIPTRDRLTLLLETLRSVAQQDLDARVVVVDDGSTDGTAEALECHDVSVVRNAAGGWGSGRARNAGLRCVTTPFVMFLDSDDLLVPQALSTLRAALKAAPEGPFAFGQALAATHGPDGWTPEGLIAPLASEQRQIAAAMLARNFVPSSGVLIRTDAARAVEGYDPALMYSEDQDFWLRLARQAEPVYVGRLVLIHRRHGDNRHVSARAVRDDDAISERAAGDPRLAAHGPARLGMQMCEETLDALRSRRPAELLNAMRRLLIGRKDRGAILAAAVRHFRRRRAARNAGLGLWRSDPALRDWLAAYE